MGIRQSRVPYPRLARLADERGTALPAPRRIVVRTPARASLSLCAPSPLSSSTCLITLRDHSLTFADSTAAVCVALALLAPVASCCCKARRPAKTLDDPAALPSSSSGSATLGLPANVTSTQTAGNFSRQSTTIPPPTLVGFSCALAEKCCLWRSWLQPSGFPPPLRSPVSSVTVSSASSSVSVSSGACPRAMAALAICVGGGMLWSEGKLPPYLRPSGWAHLPAKAAVCARAAGGFLEELARALDPDRYVSADCGAVLVCLCGNLVGLTFVAPSGWQGPAASGSGTRTPQEPDQQTILRHGLGDKPESLTWKAASRHVQAGARKPACNTPKRLL